LAHGSTNIHSAEDLHRLREYVGKIEIFANTVEMESKLSPDDAGKTRLAKEIKNSLMDLKISLLSVQECGFPSYSVIHKSFEDALKSRQQKREPIPSVDYEANFPPTFTPHPVLCKILQPSTSRHSLRKI
jgi:hypothetical protein